MLLASIAQVMTQCKDAHREHLRLLGDEKPPTLPATKGGKTVVALVGGVGGPSKDKDAVFAAALMAVHKGHQVA